MTRILVLGGGRIGTAIVSLLAGCGDYTLTLADGNESALETPVDTHVETRVVDVTDGDALRRVLDGQDAVLSALPFHLNPFVAQAARDGTAAYFDLTEDVGSTRLVKDIAHDATVAFVPQCGLAPGFIDLAAASLAHEFDALSDMRLRVGALPRCPSNALQYCMTWSIEGVINEYLKPCEAIRGGQLREIKPLEDLETFVLEGTPFEAFNTSGGLGTLSETFAGRVGNLDYKSIRYPGHRDGIRHLMNSLPADTRHDIMVQFLEAALPQTLDDIVVILVRVAGTLDGRHREKTLSRVIPSADVNGQRWSAIQIATAGGACAAVDLWRQGILPQRGFVRQEQIPLEAFLANRFGQAFAEQPATGTGHLHPPLCA